MFLSPVIEVQNQTLRQALQVVGTPFRLHYRSDRVPGRRAAYSLRIPLSGKKPPPLLKNIELEITVAGQRFAKTFPPAPNQTFAFTWDGQDGQGHPLAGKQSARIRIGYVYPGRFPRPQAIRWKETSRLVGVWDARSIGLGGWTLSAHHVYDPVGRALELGNGRRRGNLVLLSHREPNEELLAPSEDGNEVYVFDRAGRHLRTVHALTGALVCRFDYDARGHLLAVVDGYGNTTRLVRDATGTANAIINPYGQQTTLVVHSDGYLASVTNPASATTRFAYAGEGLLAGLTDPEGNVYQFAYDEQGRLAKAEDPAGGSSNLIASRSDNRSQVALVSSQQREYSYLIERLPTGEEQRINKCCGGSKTVALHGPDRSRKVIEPDGTVASTVLQPDPRWGSLSLRVKTLTRTTPAGLTSTASVSRSVALAPPDNPLRLQTQTDIRSVNGREYSSAFDAVQKQIAHTTPAGRQTIVTLEDHGRLVKAEVGGLSPTRLTYDERGRLTSITQGSGAEARVAQIHYDADGHLAAITDPLQRTQRFEYNLAWQVTKEVLEDGRELHYAYDANGNRTRVTPSGRSAHGIEYTPLNFVKSYRPPSAGGEGSDTTYAYNPHRQLTRITRPDGTTIDFLQDEAGWLSAVSSPAGQQRFAYDPKTKKLLSSTTPDGETLSYRYDGFLLLETAWAGTVQGKVGRTFDNNFWMASVGVNDGPPVVLHYDPDGLLIQAGAMTLTRDPRNGLLLGTKLGPLTSAQEYNGFGELTASRAAFNNQEIFAVHYVYDGRGRVIQKVETIEGQATTWAYQYDPAGRLSGVQQNGVAWAEYEYDPNGNRLSYRGPRGSQNGSYDAQDRLVQYGNVAYGHSANGEWTSKTANGETTRYQYDVFGDLRAVSLSDGTRIGYVLDGENRRIGKMVDGKLLQGFLYLDPVKPVAELDGQSQVISRFVYATRGNVPDYMEKGGKTYRIISDSLGSPRLVIDLETGTVVQRMDFDEFGNLLRDTSPGFQPFGFAGGLYDRDTGLVHFSARDYDPTTGRWTAKDPLRFAGSDPNLYAYVSNDPINRSDPLGLFEGIFPGFGRDMPGFGWHYDRNQNQSCPPTSPDLYTGRPECPMELESTGWGYSGRSPTHGGYHDYRNANTGAQCVYDDDGNLVTDPEYEGTYDNFPPFNADGSPNYWNWPGHVVADMLPWILWGN